MSLDIKITDTARDKIRTMIAQKGLINAILRLSIKGGGCSGFNYDMSFCDRSDKYDKTDQVNGIKIVVDVKSYLYIKGLTLDYLDEFMSSGFRFINPNVKTTCGCGTSFNT